MTSQPFHANGISYPQDVAVAVEVGMAVALLLFVSDVTSSVRVRAVPPGRPLNEELGGGVSSGTLPKVSSSALRRLPTATAASLHSLPDATADPALTSTREWMQPLPSSSSSSSSPSMASYCLASVDEAPMYEVYKSIYSSSGGDSPSDEAEESGSGNGRFVPRPLLVPHRAAYVEVSGSLLFGAGELLEEALEDMHRFVDDAGAQITVEKGGWSHQTRLMDCQSRISQYELSLPSFSHIPAYHV